MSQAIDIETFLEYSFPNHVSYSPQGTRAALVLTVPDAERNAYENSIWRVENGHLERAFLIGSSCVYCWENEESVLFLKHLGNNGMAVCRGNIVTGVTEEVAAFPLSIQNFAVMSGGTLAALCRTDINYPDVWRMTPKERERAYSRISWETENYQVVDELPFYENGRSGMVCRQRDSLFVLNLQDGTCVRITEPLFQTQYFCVDGDTIYYYGDSYRDKMSVFYQLWSYRLGDASPRCLHKGGTYNMRGLAVWNGRLLMLGNTNPNVKLFHGEFYEINKKTGEIASICKYDRSIRSYVTGDCAYGTPRLYQTDEDNLYFISSIDNEAWLMALDKAGKVRPVLRHEGAICDFDVRNGELVFTALWDNRPLECYIANMSAPENTFRRCSDFNTGALEGRYVAIPQPHSFEFDGWRIDGWAMLPGDFDPSGSYPAILDIHGGPNACYSTAFCHEMQVWAGRGFFVIFCNPVGSEGRGDDFMNIHGHFGERDYDCLMRFTDEMLKKYPQIDQSRLCVTGGSYGGFMTNWIITHTDRFAAAATQRSIANWVTTILLCDNGWYNMPLQMRGDVYTGADKLWEQSPLKYIENAKTPTLVLHSDEDYSVPVEEGLQMFSALQAKGVETRMVIFKGENHELSRSGRPLHRIRRLQEITEWLEGHI